jgi:tetratricopeptide (TPR) repeat protein
MNASALDPELLVRSAYAALDAGDATAAEAACRRALAAHPDHAAALALVGFIQLTQDRYGESVPVFDRLCLLEPNERSHWFNLGNAYRGTGNPDDALKAFARAAQLGECSADFHYNLGLTHMARGDFEAARVVLADALKLAPNDAEALHQYAHACYECMRVDAALEALENFTPAADAPAESIAGIAQVLLNLGEHVRAEALIQSVVRGGASAGTQLIHIQILERTNRLTEAADLLRTLAERPEAQTLGAEFQRVAAKIAQRQGKHELAVEHYRQALTDYSREHERHFILFSLAESLRALDRRQEHILTLLEAHQSQAAFIRRSRPMASLRGTPQMVVTEYPCDPADVAAWDETGAPPAEKSPVFVVAFPRSGTTLLELTLDAHPLLRSMDEQPFVQNALEDILARGVKYPEELAKLTPADVDEVRRRYWERAARKVKLEPGQRLVDKNPLNILRLPVMRRVFPNAPILLAVRHPCDVILSCYMQHFRAPDFALLCSEMPALTLGYRKTFDFWYEHVAMLAPRVLEVHYETFVSEFPTEVRRIADFLELPWDPAMLAPAERAHAKGYISTPSYSQVVQPVHSKAVGRWQSYREYLAPALPLLEPYLKRWGYPT